MTRGLEAARDILGGAGIVLSGWADGPSWDARARAGTRMHEIAPDAGAGFVVFGSAGSAAWTAFMRWLEANPARLAESAHPFDAFVRAHLEAADAHLEGPRRWFPCAAEAEVHLDFRTLGQLAGLGHPSRLGLLLHPTHGPWIALRAALALPRRPAGLPDRDDTPPPCVACVAQHGEGATPCARACPGDAFPKGTWHVDPCAAFHTTSTACATTCHARLACPVGQESRYPDAAIAYHYDRMGGRRALRERLGVTSDPHEGDGPHWGDWRGRIRT